MIFLTDGKRGTWWGCALALCCFVFLCTSPSVASEVCTDRDEFVHFAQRYQLLKQQNKVQDDSIKALVEKDKAWQKYKESAEPLLAEYATRLEDSIKREEALTKRNDYLEAKVAEQDPMTLMEKAEVAGTVIVAGLTARWGGKHVWRISKKLMGR